MFVNNDDYINNYDWDHWSNIFDKFLVTHSAENFINYVYAFHSIMHTTYIAGVSKVSGAL